MAVFADLRVAFCAGENTGSTQKALVAIAGKPSGEGRYAAMHEMVWNKLNFDHACDIASKFVINIATPVVVEMTTSDPEKWANTPFSDAEALLTYKAVRNAVQAGDLIFSGGSPVETTDDEEAYVPGETEPPSDQFPVT